MGTKIITFNAKGLKLAYKRQRVFKWLKKYNVDIALIQEAHCTTSTKNDWYSDWGSKNVILSYGTNNAKGVAVLYKPGKIQSKQDPIIDKNGRYMIWNCTIGAVECVLVNIYAPNVDNIDFYKNVISLIDNIDCRTIIWGGRL